MRDVAFSAESVRVRYGERDVLGGVSMQARFGEVTAIVGPNGSGKTTLLKAIAGLVPFAGRIAFGDSDARVLDRAERARRVAYVPQRTELSAAQSAYEVVSQGRFVHHGFAAPKRADRDAVARALRAVDAAALRDRPFIALSGGEQRRVLIARALATEAPILLLDEPTASLDVAHVLSTHALLRTLADEGRAVVAVLHALDDVRTRTDRAFLLASGRVVAEGGSESVVSVRSVRDVYGVELVDGAAIGFRRTEGAP
ncbi:MAG TPA: ABC transporter ATP-binding protein [Polyangiaceae bacterium]|nr:ABC transporter ATP-binding protein [Polyangiaceae bacterium]